MAGVVTHISPITICMVASPYLTITVINGFRRTIVAVDEKHSLSPRRQRSTESFTAA